MSRLHRVRGVWRWCCGCALLLVLLFWATSTNTSQAQAAAREVYVGVYNNPPKIMAAANGQPSGILGHLLQEIALQEGWRLHPVHCTWEACLAALEVGDIDLLPDVAYSEQRANTLDFHQTPALHSWSQIYRREGVELHSMLDLQGKRLMVLNGSVQEQYLRPLLAGFGITAQIMPAQNFEQSFAKVAAGEADAAAVNYHFGDQAAPRFHLLPTSLIFLPSQLYYASGKGRNSDLLATLDSHLITWQANPNSFYFQNLKQWSGALPAPPTVPIAFRWGLAIVAVLLLLALAGMLLLRREVARQTHKLRTSEEKLSTILNSIEANVFIKDAQMRYQYANRKLCEFLGLPIEQILGKSDEAFFDASTAARIREVDHLVLESGQRLVREEYGHRLGDTKKHTFLSVKLPLGLPGQAGYALCGISTEITEQRQFIEEIHQLAFYDPLTHLPNRKQLMERLHQLMTEPHTHQGSQALLLINLDNFKDLNDTHGHSAGDQLLLQVAQRLTTCARPGDMVARLGSDEFALLMGEHKPNSASTQHQIEYAATHILKVLSEMPYQIGALEYRASAGIGITVLDSRQPSVEAILKHADLALFQAKAQGRNSMRFFKPDMEVVVAARAALETDLREGLRQEQFLLYYQPQVDSQHQMFGVEALVRWQHPQRGLVPPGSFIGLAEASGLIEPLGLWILRTACTQIAHWSRNPAMAHLQVAVNISARQLHHARFVEQVLAILDETGANPERLELELTESQLVEDMEGAITKMKKLKERGVHLSLDDFGTGYSSLNHLKRLPLDQLKIDQSFVRDLLIDANDLSIVKAIVGMGHSLHLSVLAEGVETQEQRDMLEQLGCIFYQGYWFGRPMPVAQLQDWRSPGAVSTGSVD